MPLPSTPDRLLLVEDDRELGAMLGELFAEAGYLVEAVRDGQRGLHAALTRPPGVLVVDRGLPDLDGVELVRRLRARGVPAPVLLLTARGAVEDRVEGLDAGAEDYLVKPFDVGELLARVRALLRRHAAAARVLSVPGGLLDLESACLDLHPAPHPDPHPAKGAGGIGRQVQLSAAECRLLAVLARWPRRVFDRAELLDLAFDGAQAPGTVDQYVHYLRAKLGRGAVRTVHRRGYRIGSS
jgi:two-component system, OmpR family, response regulator QseB